MQTISPAHRAHRAVQGRTCAHINTTTTMASQQSPKAPGLPNPYAQRGLPNPYASATISAAPVKYTEEQAKAEQQKKAPGSYLNCSTPLP